MKFNLLPYARSRMLLTILNRTLICTLLFLCLCFVFEKISVKQQMHKSLHSDKKLAQFDVEKIEARLWIKNSMENNKRIKKILVNLSQDMPEKMQLRQLTLNEKTLQLQGIYDSPVALEHFTKIFNAHPYRFINTSTSKEKNSLLFTLNYENTHADSPKNLY